MILLLLSSHDNSVHNTRRVAIAFRAIGGASESFATHAHVNQRQLACSAS